MPKKPFVDFRDIRSRITMERRVSVTGIRGGPVHSVAQVEITIQP